MEIQRKPGIFIPTLYFAEGLPYVIVNSMLGVFLKSLGVGNDIIGLTSLYSWPWTLKFAWSPLVDFYGTKRGWVVAAQFVLAAVILGSAAVAYFSAAISMTAMLILSALAFTITAFASATHDVSIDGYYLDVLNEEQKAFFVGIRNTAYRVAMIFGSGGMIYLAGKIGEKSGMSFGWAVAFAICAAVMLLCAVFHNFYLPQPQPKSTDAQAESVPKVEHDFFKAILTYFQQPGIIAIVFYILIFRLGDALMLKQAPNFLLDPPAKAGLGVSVKDIGLISGTAGVIALLLGGLLASWLISRDGLKRWMWPFALTQSFAILLYWVLAAWPHVFAFPSSFFDSPYVPAVYVINSAEQFAYGLGVSAYTVFLLSTVKSEYKAAHYATATAMMAFGVLIPQAVSGYIYNYLGYANFFLVSFFASLPGIFAIFFLPMWREGKDIEGGGGQARAVQETGQVGSEGK